jgi:hypothetical protein
MFGLVFGETDVTSKLISYEINVDNDLEVYPISEVIGYDLPNGTIQFAGYEGDLNDHLNIYFYSSESDDGLNTYAQYFIIDAGSNALFSGIPTYYFDSHIDHMGFRNQQTPQVTNATLYFIVTAEFPQEDTGYIDEGFDYCIDVGANLVASPCRFDINIIDTLPSEIQNNLTSIIGQGEAAKNENGEWVGSLSELGGGDGYWFISNASACFNYNCAEN